MTFNTGYYSTGVLVMNRKLIVVEYLKTTFIFDAFSTFPYSYMILWITPYLEVPDTTYSVTDSYNSYNGTYVANSTETFVKVAAQSNSLHFLNILKLMRFLKILRVLRI